VPDYSVSAFSMLNGSHTQFGTDVAFCRNPRKRVEY
jgi:hypothetical protein